MSDTVANQTLTYTIDPMHSHLRFWVRHLMISKVHGEFGKVTGTLQGSREDPGSAVLEATIDAASITTGNEQRDGHIKSADFLDVEKFPTITYKAREIKLTGEEYEIVGDLTLHGVTHEVVLKAEASPEVPSPFGGTKVGVSAEGVFNREDFGVVFNMALEAGGVAIGKEVHVQIDLELDRPA